MDRISKIIEVLHQHPDMMPAVMRQIPRRLVTINIDDTQCQTFTTLELYHWLKKADKKMVKPLYKQALHFEALFPKN